MRDDLLTHAAALAYCASLSAAPLVLLTLSLVSLIGLNLHEELVRQANLFIGEKAAVAVTSVIEAAQTGSPFQTSGRIIGLMTLILSASAVVVQLHSSLNIIFGPAQYASQVKAFFMQRGIALLVVLMTILMSVASLLISAFLNATPDPELELWGKVLNLSITFISFAVLFSLLYRLVPDRPPSWTAATKSAAVTALLYMLGKEPLAAFLGNSVSADVYGAAGSLILFLLWVYYTSVIIYLGAELSLYLETSASQQSTANQGEHAWSL